MKTVSELQAERDTLQAALVETQALANERTARSYQLQTVTSAVVLGTKTRADLEHTQRRLEESVEALTRVEHLRQAVADIDQQIVVAKGFERRTVCADTKQDFDQLHADYVAQSRQLLQTVKQMHGKHVAHLGLTARPLMSPMDYRLHLPAVMSPNDSPAFCTGDLIQAGSL